MNRKKSMLSVIVPVYGVEQYLDECIESIVNQTYKNLEIILVDDGSPDKCPEICDKWAEKDQRIKVIHKKNGGLSDARNAGLDKAVGEYIAFIDSDDWIEAEMFECMLASVKNGQADICACGIRNCYEDGHSTLWDIVSIEGTSKEIFSLLYKDTRYPVAAYNKLYHYTLWDNFRFPVGKICEDAFTTYMLIDKAKKIVQIKDAFYCYRIRNNSIMTSKFRKARMDEEEAWRVNYKFIAEKYPKLKKIAYDFYLSKVNVLIHTIEDEQIPEFKKEYSFLKNILKANILYILFESQLLLKQRVKLVLDIITLR